MRIYELAQLKDVPNKEIVQLLQDAGFDVKNHMSVLNDEALSFIDKELSDKTAHSVHSVHPINSEKIEPKMEEPLPVSEPVQEGIILEPMSVADFAQKTKKTVTDVIVTLLKWGIIVAKNQVIAEDIIQRLARHYEIPVIKSQSLLKQEPVLLEKINKAPSLVARSVARVEKLQERPPVIVVVGHVDHGKTTLLDFIRNTRVALKEKGGITQHLGAYEVSTAHGPITFLDTPGHEAFGKIRHRGVRVADIVVLVVAADDGVMPQTVEAIKYAQAMQVPIIVAINKIDKVEPNRLDSVKTQLNQYGLTAEDWGGDTICMPISAKTGTGVDQLIEIIALQAEMMELRADVADVARGYILEARMEKGLGPVATVMCQSGLLHTGDYFICGATAGHVSSLINSYGKRVKEVSPSIPVQVASFDELPQAGDFFTVVPKTDYLKARSGEKSKIGAASKRVLYENGINLVLKSDTHSSQEAIVEGIDKLSKKVPKGFNILRQDIGDINESDVEFAFNTGANIIGFNVKTETNAVLLADRRKVEIAQYGIIYKLLEDLEQRSQGLKEIEMVRTKIGEATVLRVFDIKKIGVIAGCIVKDGRFTRDGYAVMWRGRSKIGEGKISSLQRDKRAVKEVFAGFECGFLVEGFSDWHVDDRVECYIDMPKK